MSSRYDRRSCRGPIESSPISLKVVTGKSDGQDFAVVSNPEFLREGTAIKDYLNPPFTLIGTSSPRAAEIMGEVYAGVHAPFIRTEIQVAEMIKYVNNSFHALKISFANEVGNICLLQAPEHRFSRLMDVFCRDTSSNISPYYLKPGFAYGGSCLPKDLKALCTIAHDGYLNCPVLESIDVSNERQKTTALETILAFEKQRIGFLGLSFKEGTDDLRGSPVIDILEKLLGKGYDIRIYDRNVQLSKLTGANREFILQRIPLISRFIFNEIGEVTGNSDLIVVVNDEPAFRSVLEGLSGDKIIYDLVNIPFLGRSEHPNSHGIAW